MIWKVPHIWEGGDVYIIGGGPSIPTQFNIPNKIVQDVIKGISPPSVYSPYMSFLHDKHVIGINVAYLLGDWIDMIFFGDSSFFTRHVKKLAFFPGLKISCHPVTESYNWIKYLSRDSKPRGISSNSRSVSWNSNSGSAAISIAAHAGAKRIILLGFDMKLDEKEHQHWHDLYGRYANRNDKSIKKMPFDRHLQGFPEIARDAKRMGIEILNASPDSAIECFRKINITDLMPKIKVAMEEELV
jgi:hypothetical protein